VKNKVRRTKVLATLTLGWVHTIVGLILLLLFSFVFILLLLRFAGWIPLRLIASIIGIVILFALLISPVAIKSIGKLRSATRDEAPRFLDAMQTFTQNMLWIFPPRPYLCEVVDGANAFAFGWGPFRGIAISEALYNLLDDIELKAVLAHEIAHLRCRDVGIITTICALTRGSLVLSTRLARGLTPLALSPIAWIMAAVLWSMGTMFSAFGVQWIARQREYAADALGSWYIGSTKPLIAALQKLHDANSSGREDSVLKDLLISHPHVSKRISALMKLER